MSATRSAHDAVAGPLVVGTWGSTAAGLLAPIVERMSAAFPEVSISSREVDLDAASTSVRYGEVDVAFGLDYADAPMPRDPLGPAGAAAAGDVRGRGRRPARSPSAAALRRASRRSRDLDWILPPESTQYGRAIRSGFRRHGFEPRVVHEVTDTAASLQLAAAGLGATVMTGLMRRLNTSLDLDRAAACATR